MEWQVILVLPLTISILLILVVLIWCVNIGSIYATIKDTRVGQAAPENKNVYGKDIAYTVAEAAIKRGWP